MVRDHCKPVIKLVKEAFTLAITLGIPNLLQPDLAKQQDLSGCLYAQNQLEGKTIYELEPDLMERDTVRQLDSSANDISHVGYPIGWTRDHGRVVYQNQRAT